MLWTGTRLFQPNNYHKISAQSSHHFWPKSLHRRPHTRQCRSVRALLPRILGPRDGLQSGLVNIPKTHAVSELLRGLHSLSVHDPHLIVQVYGVRESGWSTIVCLYVHFVSLTTDFEVHRVQLTLFPYYHWWFDFFWGWQFEYWSCHTKYELSHSGDNQMPIHVMDRWFSLDSINSYR